MSQAKEQTIYHKLSDQLLIHWLHDQFERLLLLHRNRLIDSSLFDHELATDDQQRYSTRIQMFLSQHLGEDSDDRAYRLLAEVIASFDGNTAIVPERWETRVHFEEYTHEENRFLRDAWNRLKPTANSLMREIVETYFPAQKKELLVSGLSDDIYHLAN